eukprot:gene5986-8243_t
MISARYFLLLVTIMCVILFVIKPISKNTNSYDLYKPNTSAAYKSRTLAESIKHLSTSANHKDLFPLDSRDYYGTTFVVLGLLIAASGGIGGGGILVPLLILVYDFSPKHAIALSNFCIVGSSITNMWMNLYKRHPDADRPLVDWDLILVMEPLTMAGAVVGAIVSKVLPDWLLVISLVILLAYTTYTTLLKGIEQFKKETKAKEFLKKSELSKAIIEDEENAETERLLPLNEPDDSSSLKQTINPMIRIPHKDINNSNSVNSDEAEAGNDSSIDLDSSFNKNNQEELNQLIESEKVTPKDKVVILSCMILAVVILNLMKGGGGNFPSPIGIKCGSYNYWMMTGLVLLIVFIVSIWMRSILIEKWKRKKVLNYRYAIGDVEWNERNTIVYPIICFFAGFFAGMFGVGGGIVKGPLMLQMGTHPLVASATVAVMIMFTSVAATTMFIAFGTLTWDYGIFLFIVGLLATIVGQYGVIYLVQKYQRVSLVSLSIGAVVAISTVLMAIQSVFSLIDAQENISPDSNSLCGK